MGRFVPHRNYEYFSRGFSLGSILALIHIVIWMCRGLRIHNDNKTLWGEGIQEEERKWAGRDEIHAD